MSQQKRSNSVQRFNKKLKKAIEQLLSQFKTLLQTQGKWLLRCLLITKKIPKISLSLIKKVGDRVKQILGKVLFSPPQTSLYKSKGFILPTIAIVLLVFALVVGSIVFRSANRTQQVVDQREKQIVDTATTPAIQRARAKVESLFGSGDIARLAPGSDIEKALNPYIENPSATPAIDIKYRLPDETRIDINNDNTLDNAWSFDADIDGDGTDEKIVYSILTLTPDDNVANINSNSSDEDKTKNLVVRQLPIAIGGKTPGCDFAINTKSGWYSGASTSNFFRAFQITTVAIKNNDNDRSYSALQLQQDRESDLGNKWGAWFLNDLEIFPGPSFNWNGAIHTEGNLIVGNNGNNTRFRGYLISDPKSCIYNPKSNSEVTIAKFDSSSESDAPNNGLAFEGQMLSATVTKNAFNTGSRWDIWTENGPLQPFNNSNTFGSGNNKYYTMNPTYDSVTDQPAPGERLLEPVQLLTEGVKQSRSDSNPENEQNRDGSWESSKIVKEGRIFNQNEVTPFVDDTYRADDRYGQKPVYGTGTAEIKIPATKNVGDRIETADFPVLTDPAQVKYDELVNNNLPTTTVGTTNKISADNLGLDGYWERRAWAEGLRIIVGQRLELGDRFGWQGSNEALYPPVTTPATSCRAGARCHERRQYKTLLDNLAAVQSTAVYTDYTKNSDQTKREFPVACIASTAHPGTQKTITDSTTFANSANGAINTNFFFGEGTNGWEFNPPANLTTEEQFRQAIQSGQPLRRALTNLAYFAGDPFGAFPADQDTTDTSVLNPVAVPAVGLVAHPYPYLKMWGDFSNLRRTIDDLDANTLTYQTVPTSGTNINDLSIADKTTLQTASCTLGMLAYNINNVENNSASVNQNVANALATAYGDLTSTSSSFPAILNDDGSDNGYVKPDSSSSNPISEDLLAQFELKYQIDRDRRYGFKPQTPSTNNYTIPSGITFEYDGTGYGDGTPNPSIDFGFDYEATNYLGFGNGATPPSPPSDPKDFIRLALLYKTILEEPTKPAADQTIRDDQRLDRPKYPSLYYIFPTNNHDFDGSVANDDDQPVSEEYIRDPNLTAQYINRTEIGNTNGNNTYQAISSTDLNAIETDPRPLNNFVFQCQEAPASPGIRCSQDPGNGINDKNQITNQTTNPSGETEYVTLLDKGIFNGREMMAVRTLDIDLNLLRHNRASDMTENWLPDSGIVYAFREDGVREDGIARPAQTASGNCNTFALITTSGSNCLMDAVGNIAPSGIQQDPPVNKDNGISPKPVDGYADPDRRPYGFRLRNGIDLRRCTNTSVLEGLSFITDNPTYISADTDDRGFNFHARADSASSCDNSSYSNRIEEFNNLLNSNFSDFYTRGSSGVNGNFARIGDTWRPTTILSDAITITSSEFTNGSIDRGLTNSGGTNSFRNMNYPETQPNSIGGRSWLREDGELNNSVNNTSLPIRISRNGYPIYSIDGNETIEYGNETTNRRPYRDFNEGKTRTEPRNANRINAIMISGLIPSRPNQSYGGLHNFPRFIERWRTDLFISGAFLQLNFSTYGTAPFDQDSWEPGFPAQNSERIQYYGAPGRRWGYDVGLQYAPAGPVEERFVTNNKNVSEFFRQLPTDDPYVKSLRCASDNNGKIDPTISASDCATVNN